MRRKQIKRISDSTIDDHTHILFPNDLNSNQTAFGGRVIEIADRVAATVARRHSGLTCVTLLIDSVRFWGPAKQGEALIFKAAINRVWKTSMEVGVKVLAENFESGKSRHVVSAYFTFVAINRKGRPIKLPSIRIVTEDEKRRYEEADFRRKRRLKEIRRGDYER